MSGASISVDRALDAISREQSVRRQPLKIDVDQVLDCARIPAHERERADTVPVLTTRGRQIAESAIALFNDHGVARLSINQLASYIGISPGNLHYHFRTNSDLYRSLFQILNTDVREILLRPHMPMTLDDIVQHQIDLQACLWRYRFFFRDLDYLVHSDSQIFVEFVHLQNWAVDQLVILRQFYEANFNLKPIGLPISMVEVAQNTWMLWISWIRWEAIANPQPLDAVGLNKVFYSLVWHHFSLHAASMSPEAAQSIARKLRRKLSIGDR